MIRIVLIIAFMVWAGSAHAATVKVATVNFAPVLGNVTVNRQSLVDLTIEAAQAGAKIIVHTEMATSGYSYFSREQISGVAEQVPGATTQALGAVASQYGVYVAVGMPEYDPDLNEYFNSVVLIGPDGKVVGSYRKRNNLLEASYNAEDFDPVPVFDTPYGKIGIVICADMFYPHFPRAAAVAGTNILLAPANVGITTGFMKVRTFENNFAMIVANRYGTGLQGKKLDFFNQNSFTIASPFPYNFEYNSRSVIMTAGGQVLAEIDADETKIGYGELQIGETQTFPVVRKPGMYSLIGQDTLESYTFSQLGLPPPTTVTVAGVDPGPSATPWAAALSALQSALDMAKGQGQTLRLTVLPEGYFDTLDAVGFGNIQSFANANAVDVLVNVSGGPAPVSTLAAFNGETYTYTRTHRRRNSPISPANLSSDYWVVDRDYARVALMQGVDMLLPETTLVLAKMGVDVIAVSANDSNAILNDLWATRTGNYVHIVVANMAGDEGVFLGGYKSNPSQKVGQGTIMLPMNTADVRPKKGPRFFDYRQIVTDCAQSNC